MVLSSLVGGGWSVVIVAELPEGIVYPGASGACTPRPILKDGGASAGGVGPEGIVLARVGTVASPTGGCRKR